MIAFWMAAFLATAAATALIVLYARRPVAIVDDPAQTVYLRQIEEIDDLAARDLIGEDEQRSAKAEAARRVLGEKAAAPERAVTKASRIIVAAARSWIVFEISSALPTKLRATSALTPSRVRSTSVAFCLSTLLTPVDIPVRLRSASWALDLMAVVVLAAS